jgi:hypothetical protein
MAASLPRQEKVKTRMAQAIAGDSGQTRKVASHLERGELGPRLLQRILWDGGSGGTGGKEIWKDLRWTNRRQKEDMEKI